MILFIVIQNLNAFDCSFPNTDHLGLSGYLPCGGRYPGSFSDIDWKRDGRSDFPGIEQVQIASGHKLPGLPS